MKLNNTQINALAEKLTDEINKQIEKELPGKIKETINTFKTKEPKKYNQLEEYYKLVQNIKSLVKTKEELGKLIDKWYNTHVSWSDNIEDSISRHFELNFHSIKVSQSTIKQDIILGTIDSNDMNDIIKSIKAKYL